MRDESAKVGEFVSGRLVLEFASGERTTRVEVEIDGVTPGRARAIVHAAYAEAMAPEVSAELPEWVKS